MANTRPSREQLERRRDEIQAKLNRVNTDLRIELDRDTEEQAIQLEQDDVAITMESQLRRELQEIEEMLLEEDQGE
jgi:uncharacterized FlaG/YvyC family protein